MRTNYKGFDLTYSLDKHSNIIIEKVEGSLTNQIALLTHYLNEDKDYDATNTLFTELGYKYFESNNYVDFAIDIENWIMTGDKEQQRVMIELLEDEQTEILERITEIA